MSRRPWTVVALPFGALTAFVGVLLAGGLRGDDDLPILAATGFVVALLVFGVWSARTGAWLLAIAVAGVCSVGAVLALTREFSVPSLIVLIGAADALMLLNLAPTREWVGSERGGATI